MNPIGHIDLVTRFYIVGWVADLEDLTRPVELSIFVDGEGCDVIRPCDYREDLKEIAPGASGRYAFRFYFPRPLLPFHRHEIAVVVADTGFVITRELPALDPLAPMAADAADRPQGPILLTSAGRSGSTAIMATLARHPQVVVSGNPPFEVELGCYYAHALRTMVAAGDHERSLKAEFITAAENRYHVGFNPFMEPSYLVSFHDESFQDRFLNNNVAGHLGGAFRNIILDYYAALARSQGRDRPLYFAEKILPEPDGRFGVRFLFPNVKEITLIRDLRDVLCSFIRHANLTFDAALDDMTSVALRFQEMRLEPGGNNLFLRYEDFVLQPEATIDRLFRYLGLSPVEQDMVAMDRLFGSHATSRSPAESIGRWRRELSREQLERCRPLAPFLEDFGYEPLPTVSHEPVAVV